MTVGIRITYGQLLERHKSIRVPMIQRDYAQGRSSESEVRDEFLSALEAALQKLPDDPSLPLNLDFIYGSVEGDDSSFLPLDGQQRLTTLFLLHWYLAWADDRWTEFATMFLTAEGSSRFTYRVRPSSKDFFDAFAAFRPGNHPADVDSLSAVIRDQAWYFRGWRLDPTVQSALGMLDAVHRRFSRLAGLFARLNDATAPAVTFQLLDLDNFGLSDDLYIKMNARGKPLTAFETFKARYEQELLGQFPGTKFSIGSHQFSAADYISRRLDTTWGDLFWTLRDSQSASYDAALMNMFRSIALVSRDPESEFYAQDVAELRSSRSPTFSDFHQRGWLDEAFTLTLTRVLDTWRAENGRLVPVLPSSQHFDESFTFDRIAHLGANLPYADVVQFACYALYIRANHDRIEAKYGEQWMRLACNLAINTAYNRSEDLRRSIVGVVAVIEYAHRIEQHLTSTTNSVSGFNEQQVTEERLKAQLILAHPAWRALLYRAEGHPYFRGQVEFLLDFAGVIRASAEGPPDSWTDEFHEQLRTQFLSQLRLAELMFWEHGLRDTGEHRWQRALLCIGNYLLPSGRNRSFANSTIDEGSWKRLLRGGPLAAQRSTLRALWSQLSPDDALGPQLDRIIDSATNLEPWRDALVRTVSAIDYCEQHCIRFTDDAIFLLKRTQLNGAHVELFTYCLHSRLGRNPVSYPSLTLTYSQVTDTYVDPFLAVSAQGRDRALTFSLRYASNRFELYASKGSVGASDGVAMLLAELEFSIEGEYYVKRAGREGVDAMLALLDNAFKQ